MRMLALPIARRELLVLSRAWATWKNRIGVSVMVLAGGILLSLLYQYGGQIVLTQAMHFIGGGLSVMCLFAGITLTADSIAEEKRGGTLGLLFLTHLSPFEIVFGKLVAHAVAGFYTAMCALPLLSMSMIYGGMRFSEVLMYMGSSLNALFYSAAVGLFASSLCRERGKAVSLGTVIIIVFLMLLPAAAAALSALRGPPWLIMLLAQISVNVFSPLSAGLARIMPSVSQWWSATWTQILAWTFIGMAVWLLPRRWQDEPPRKRRRLRDLWTALSLGSPATRLKLRRKLLDQNAFMWLACRDRLQALGMWIASFAVIVFFAFPLFFGKFPPELLISVAITMTILQQVIFSSAAGAQLIREYEQGTLEMVLSTALSAEEVIRGQFMAAQRHYRKAFMLTFLLLWAGVIALIWNRSRGWLPATLGLAAYSGFFALQIYATGWVGMWTVVIAPVPKKAQGAAFFCLTILPLMLFGLIVGAVQFFMWLTGITFSAGPELALSFLILLVLGNTIFWLSRAKRELPQKLRLFAFQRYASGDQPTVWGEIGKLLGRLWGRTRTRDKQVLIEPR